MRGRKVACAVLVLGCLAGPAFADSVQLISRIAPGLSPVTADRESRTYMLSPWPIDFPPPSGSRLSVDGRYVVFSSHATNLVAGLTDANDRPDLYNRPDLYLHDRITGTTTLVTRSADDPLVTSNGWSFAPVISADGRYVAYFSNATNLVGGQIDANKADDVFVFDRVTGTNRLVSRAAGTSTTTGDGESSRFAFSADGRWIAFSSKATDLVAGQGAGPAYTNQVFLFDLATSAMTLVSHAAASATTPGNGESGNPSLSADGSLLVYESTATDLGEGLTDTNGAIDVFLYHRAQGRSALVSRSDISSSRTGQGASSGALLSADGSHVVFVSEASDLVAGQSGPAAVPNIFLYRRSDGSMTLVSHAMAGLQQTGDGTAHSPAINEDGSYVAFVSNAQDLAAGSTLPVDQLFLFQRADGSVTRLSDQPPPPVSWSWADHPRISTDGSRVVFAQELVLDTQPISYLRDIHLYSRGTRTLVSHSMASPSTRGNGSSTQPELSADGQIVAFSSFASDLVERDFNHATDVFLYNPATGTHAAATRSVVPAQSPVRSSLRPAISEDGNIVVFDSQAPNLVPGQVDGNWGDDVFVWSRTEGTTRLVSRAAGTTATAIDGFSRAPALSADGDWIAFKNIAASSRIFLVERVTGATILVTHVPGAPATSSPGSTSQEEPPVLSRDGRYLAFTGTFTDLLPGETLDGRTHAFLYDRLADSTVVASRAAGTGGSSGGGVVAVDLSADGRFLVFTSTAADLIPDLSDTNGAADLFLYDRDTGDLRLISGSSGAPSSTANAASSSPVISADGRWIAFSSLASNLVAGQVDSGSTLDAFLYDRVAGTMTLASHAFGQPATAAGTEEGLPDLSADGRFLVFGSKARNLTGFNINGFVEQVFLYDRTTGENLLVSHQDGHPTWAANSGSSRPRISADGRFVTFTSESTELVHGVGYGSGRARRAFLYERSADTTEVVSRRNGLPIVAGQGDALAVSADGGQVVLGSSSPLVPEDDNDHLSDLADLYLYENVLPGADYYTAAFCRALDTRDPIDGPALVSGVRQLFTVPGACGIPATAKAVALNVTAIQAAGQGYLKLHAGNASSQSSALNFTATQARSNNVIVRLSTNGDGTIAITPFVAGGGTVHVILDVEGYYEWLTPGAPAGRRSGPARRCCGRRASPSAGSGGCRRS